MIHEFRHPRRILLHIVVFVLLLLLVMGESFVPAKAESRAHVSTIPTNGETIYVPLIYHLRHSPREQTVFGVQMYGYSGYNRKEFQPLNQSGAAWVRNELHWRGVEPENTEPENYRWRTVENVVAAATDGNYHILLTFNFAPEWAAERTNGPINDANLTDFVEYVGAVVERLDGDGIDDLPGSPVVEYFQFYNEPDRRSEPGDRSAWGNAPTKYADMLKAVAPAIRAANPNAKIVFGGVAHDWFEDQSGPYVRDFVDKVLDEDVGDSFDIFAFHAYPPFALNWASQGPGLYEKSLYMRDKLTEHGLDKPIIISESGMHSNDDPGYPMTEELQARYVVQLFAEAIAADIDVMIWFSLVDPPSWFPTKNGLLSDEDPPYKKLAYKTYQTTVDILTGTRADAVLNVAETGAAKMQAYRLRDDAAGRTVYAAWMTPIDGDGVAPLSLPGASATVIATNGGRTTVSDGDDGVNDGRVTVTVTAAPQYIEVKD